MGRAEQIVTSSPEETLCYGRAFSKELSIGSVVAFRGDLGAGKTTLIKGIIAELAGISPAEVTSPTFTYLHIYEAEMPIYHFDLYRIATAEEFLARGFDENLGTDGVCLIEWSERIHELLPPQTTLLSLSLFGREEGRRTILQTPWSP